MPTSKADLTVTVPQRQHYVDQLEDLLQQLMQQGIGISPRLAQRRLDLERGLLALEQPDRDPSLERRSFVRVPCQLKAILHTPVGTTEVMVINIGGGGARFQGPIALEVGDDVEIEIEMDAANHDLLLRFGTICWAQGGEAGMAFEAGTEPLNQLLLRYIIQLLHQS